MCLRVKIIQTQNNVCYCGIHIREARYLIHSLMSAWSFLFCFFCFLNHFLLWVGAISNCSFIEDALREQQHSSCFASPLRCVLTVGGGGSENGNGNKKAQSVLPFVCSSYKITNKMKCGEWCFNYSYLHSSIYPRYFKFEQNSIFMFLW